jgi:YfiH family protein
MFMSLVSLFWGNDFSSPVSKELYCKSFGNYYQVFGDDFVLHQKHGTDGIVVDLDTKQLWPNHVIEGDYLITTLKNTWIGVTTADCLPIIFYDTTQAVVAIAHAGWRGSVNKITQIVMQKLTNDFNCAPKNIKIFFGPSAQTCCYEVSQKFIDNLSHDAIAQECIKKRESTYFFDVSRYNMISLRKCGVPIGNFNLENNVCTICNIDYCSYRRQRDKTRLQISMVALH